MNLRLLTLLLTSLSILFYHSCVAQQAFENTISFDDTQPVPTAKISDMAWLAGHWRGEAFGGIIEEVWSTPLGNSMMGAFKLVVDHKVVFYEIETITQIEKTLLLQLKHFNDDLTGWEEKDKTVDFKLVKVMPSKYFFDGFTIERISDNEINMYVVIEDKGIQEEVKFNYKRVD